MPEQLSLPLWRPSESLAARIDYTVVTPSVGADQLTKHCEEAVSFGFHSLCVNGGWVRLCRERLSGTNVKVSAVVGFPIGAQATRSKAFEAAAALDDGASEIDMVLSAGKLKDGDHEAVERDIAAVVLAVQGGALIKVILETGSLTDEQKKLAARIAETAGADYVQTSTGYGVTGATEADVRLLRAELSPTTGVKASGGVRDAAMAIALLQAGAHRIGSSSGVAIVNGT
ncbi:deoxyribose-phosphate aldolase [Cohnella endophytica]|uniref:Deoxyribose-phosphate aldolase n=1 Tax=Cohnella endophytica TaxID=2419778 RepID=A0A494XXB2_9BACL|nr:deoxyribose-phosphate aldolase [Cohnella endophytica]RKP55205.1 deoxyribose-phosphate aldolase [Cohnella endophytica]